VGSTFGAISERSLSAQHVMIIVGIGGEPVSSYRTIDGGLEETPPTWRRPL